MKARSPKRKDPKPNEVSGKVKEDNYFEQAMRYGYYNTSNNLYKNYYNQLSIELIKGLDNK